MVDCAFSKSLTALETRTSPARGDAGADVEGETDHFAAADRVLARMQADPDL
ncbi:hypothetical protein J2R73_001406 [Bradyrhizobium japonicum]|nr:hypothetical protein [Bradyrhizobium liaoningense]MCP1738730.1 hypothetical protein [Bradyrhizobium japonicum]MBR1069093.1 hypothetical protein [Bradyrhizobium liaoningense]MCP1776915.1 hypothetical protein [Bradyrhizobium japonicum]MCP1856402.1 hypothetical protein [Bradyrhizobium japonicum]